MTTHLGFDVLTIPPNALSAWTSSVSRVVDRADNPQGNVLTATRTDAAQDTRPLTWHCATRADLTALRAVLDARLGAVVPLWVPSYQRDMHVLNVVPFTGAIVTSTAICSLIPTTATWQQWAALAPGGALAQAYTWNTATDNGDGTHTLNVALTSGYTSAAGYVHSRMALCHLTSGYRVDVLGAVATVTAEFTQITSGS